MVWLMAWLMADGIASLMAWAMPDGRCQAGGLHFLSPLCGGRRRIDLAACDKGWGALSAKRAGGRDRDSPLVHRIPLTCPQPPTADGDTEIREALRIPCTLAVGSRWSHWAGRHPGSPTFVLRLIKSPTSWCDTGAIVPSAKKNQKFWGCTKPLT